MNDLKELEEIMMDSLENRSTIPQGIWQFMQNACDMISKIYEIYQCMSPDTKKCIDETKEKLGNIIFRSSIGEERKRNLESQIRIILDEMKNQLENIEGKELKEVEVKHDKELFSKIKSEDYKEVSSIISLTEQALIDIKSNQSDILRQKRYEEARIKQIQEQAQNFINRIIANPKNEEEVYKIFQKDTEELKEELLKLFEAFIGEKKSSKGAEFKAKLDAQIPLAEQNKFASGVMTEQENKEEKQEDLLGLPGDVIF